MASLNFNADEVPDEPKFSVIPAGDVVVVITSESGDPAHIKLDLTIDDGEYAGRRLWQDLRLGAPTEGGRAYANRMLKQMCNAVGRQGVNDSSEMVGWRMVARLKVIPEGHVEKNGFTHSKAKNEVESYHPIKAATPRAAVPSHAAPPHHATKTAGIMPWQRGATAA